MLLLLTCIFLPSRGYNSRGGVVMSKRKRKRMDALSLDREQRLCPEYDSTGIRKIETAAPGDMGMRVVDDCAEEHQM